MLNNEMRSRFDIQEVEAGFDSEVTGGSTKERIDGLVSIAPPTDETTTSESPTLLTPRHHARYMHDEP